MLYTDNHRKESITGIDQVALVRETGAGGGSERKFDRRWFLKMTGAAAGTVAAASMLGGLSGIAGAGSGTGVMTAGTPLDPLTIPRYVTPLFILPVYDLSVGEVKVDAARMTQQILPLKNGSGKSTGFGPTTVYAYGGKAIDASTGKTASFRHAPGATFLAKKGVATRVEWVNNITGPHFLAVDPTIRWANPNSEPAPGPPFKAFPSGYLWAQDPVPVVAHLHGGEVSSAYDGSPDGWFTKNGKYGPQYSTRHYVYPNTQEAAPLWYHDHAPGMTRLNLLAGLAGFYLIQDPDDRVAPLLPDGKYWIQLAIQDRSFYARDTEGHNELAFPNAGGVPGVHPYWSPGFFGDAITVNGHTWPYLDVDRGQYRLTILNGCNARFLNLFLDNGMTFVAISSDGGYLQSPSRQAGILVPPGSRVEILLDFTFVAPGTEIVLRNDARAPYPGGDPVNPDTTGQVMKFRVGRAAGFAPKKLPLSLNPTLCGQEWPVLRSGGLKRVLTLNEQADAQGNLLGLFLNGQARDAAASETPKNGATEDWYLVSLSDDAHPVHLHLVQFQVVSRQGFDAPKYNADWLSLNKEGLTDGVLPFKTTWKTKALPFEPYLTPGTRTVAQPDEKGWKDTVRAMPGQVTRIRVRFRRQNGTPYSFDPAAGPGYAWHCQIVDHEDNEMIRPLIVKK